MGGAQLLEIQKNRYWKHGDTLCLDAGPFVAAIEYVPATTVVVAGTPSAEFFGAAAAALDIEPTQLVVVGDDLQTDVRGAQPVGARAALVKTCKFRGTATSTMWTCARTSRWTRGQLLAALRLGG